MYGLSSSSSSFSSAHLPRLTSAYLCLKVALTGAQLMSRLLPFLLTRIEAATLSTLLHPHSPFDHDRLQVLLKGLDGALMTLLVMTQPDIERRLMVRWEGRGGRAHGGRGLGGEAVRRHGEAGLEEVVDRGGRMEGGRIEGRGGGRVGVALVPLHNRPLSIHSDHSFLTFLLPHYPPYPTLVNRHYGAWYPPPTPTTASISPLCPSLPRVRAGAHPLPHPIHRHPLPHTHFPSLPLLPAHPLPSPLLPLLLPLLLRVFLHHPHPPLRHSLLLSSSAVDAEELTRQSLVSAIFAVVLLALGSYALSSSTTSLSGVTLPAGLICLGVFILLLACVGAASVWAESHVGLAIHLVALLAIVISLFALSVTVLVQKQSASAYIHRGWVLSVEFACCGLTTFPSNARASCPPSSPTNTTCLPLLVSAFQANYVEAGGCGLGFAVVMGAMMAFVLLFMRGLGKRKAEAERDRQRAAALEDIATAGSAVGGAALNSLQEEEEDDTEGLTSPRTTRRMRRAKGIRLSSECMP